MDLKTEEVMLGLTPNWGDFVEHNGAALNRGLYSQVPEEE